MQQEADKPPSLQSPTGWGHQEGCQSQNELVPPPGSLKHTLGGLEQRHESLSFSPKETCFADTQMLGGARDPEGHPQGASSPCPSC